MIKFYEILPADFVLADSYIDVFDLLEGRFLGGYFLSSFDTYWLLKTLYLSLHLRHAFSKMRENEKINWLNELRSLTNDKRPTTHNIGNWQDIYHLVILPMYNEPYEVVRDSFESLAKINYPKEKMIVVSGDRRARGKSSKKLPKKLKPNSVINFIIPGNHPSDGPSERNPAKDPMKAIRLKKQKESH